MKRDFNVFEVGQYLKNTKNNHLTLYYEDEEKIIFKDLNIEYITRVANKVLRNGAMLFFVINDLFE